VAEKKQRDQITVGLNAEITKRFELRIGLSRPKTTALNLYMEMVNRLPDLAVDPFMRAVEYGARSDHAGLMAAIHQVCKLLTQGPTQLKEGSAARPPVVGEVGRPSNGSSQRPKSRGGRPRKANHQ
jgi:hypothetical protein